MTAGAPLKPKPKRRRATGISKTAFEALTARVDELEKGRTAFDLALYGDGDKEEKEKAVFPRITSLERDRNLLRWLIALLGGLGFTAISKYLPWLHKD